MSIITAPHIALRAGEVVEVSLPDTDDIDMCGIPSHIRESEVRDAVQMFYQRARTAYREGNKRQANGWLSQMGAARGVYGLGSAAQVYPKSR